MSLAPRFAVPLAVFLLAITLSPDIALAQCDADDRDFRERITAPGTRGAANPGLPLPHQVHAVPHVPAPDSPGLVQEPQRR